MIKTHPILFFSSAYLTRSFADATGALVGDRVTILDVKRPRGGGNRYYVEAPNKRQFWVYEEDLSSENPLKSY